MEKIDVICPILFVDHKVFKQCLDSWIREIPINTLYIGIGAFDKRLTNLLHYYQLKVNIVFVKQHQYTSLGFCLKDLINRVKTKWFIYLHSDVELLSNWFSLMWDKRVKGITESLKHPSCISALSQSKRTRAYSGAQLIYKKVLYPQIEKWEDDYIFSSEDILLQHYVRENKCTYQKVKIYHNHYRTHARSKTYKELLDLQWKALVKYANPTQFIIPFVKKPIRVLKKKFKKDIDNIFIKKNRKWEERVDLS